MHRDEDVRADSSRLPHAAGEFVAVVSLLDAPHQGATLRGTLRVAADGRWTLALDGCAELTGTIFPGCPMGALLAAVRG